MSHTPYDKSALKEYCKPEGVHDLAELDAHINPLVPNEELQLCRADEAQTSSDKHKNKKILRIPPRRLAFCGGGVRCVAHVGVLKALDNYGLLRCVKEVTGISAGAFFSLLFSLQYTIDQIERLSLEMDFTVLGNIEPEDVLMFPLTFGLNSGESIERLIASVLRQKGFSADITLGELYKKVPIGFRCYATELQTSSIKEFSARNTPNTKVVTAVRASMSFPLMYSPVKDGDSLLVDGGLLHNLPLVFLTQEEIHETLGVFFAVENSLIPAPIDDMLQLFKYMYDAAILMRNRPYMKKYKERLIIIKTHDFNALDFSETRTKRADLITSAFQSTEDFLINQNPPKRRFSVS